MAVFTISDLHLSSSGQKPMDVFGARWQNHTEKLLTNWQRTVTDSDTVIIPGDISWGDSAEDAKNDFLFLERLNGRKILGKGNHDFWWQTMSKMEAFAYSLGAKSISFLSNNAFVCEDFIICGGKGYLPEGKSASADEKYSNRAAVRLELSLKEGEKLLRLHPDKKLRVFLHYPPAYGGVCCAPVCELITKYRVPDVYCGHLHSPDETKLHRHVGGARLHLIAADSTSFCPVKVI